VSDPTSSAAAVVADTIVRTVELGVTITDAAVDGDVTVLFCTLLDDGQRQCPGCGKDGSYRDTVICNVTDVPVVGHPLRLRVGSRATDVSTPLVSGKCSPTAPIASHAEDGARPGGAPATSCAG